MAWSNSKVSAAFVKDALDRTNPFDLDTDQFKASLYNDTITPDNTVAAANFAYGAGVWATGEVSDAAEWPATGEILDTPDVTVSTTTITWDAADTVSTGTSATLASVFGCLVYDDTLTTPVADQGVCYNYFGGTNSVTDGTFTIVWATAGIASVSVA